MARSFFNLAVCLGIVSLMSATARADDIYLYAADNTPQLKPFRENVTVLRHNEQDGVLQLVFRTSSGTEQAIDFPKIARLTIAADVTLSQADDAFALRSFDKAVDGYLKAIRTRDEWKLRWITPRLAAAAVKTARFDAALVAYIGLAKLDPASAIESKPTLPTKGSKFLDDGRASLDTALRTATTDSEKQALLSLLLDIQIARSDTAGANAVANQLMSATGEDADPRLAGMLAGIRLDQAKAALDAGRFDEVATLLDPIRTRLNDPAQQAAALFLTAKANAGLAGADAQKQLDAAIAFMRVAAHFQQVEARPFVGESLIEAAKITAAIGDAASARLLCVQIESEFPGTPFAQQASQLRARLPES